MTRFTIQLLGQFRICETGGAEIAGLGKRAQALIAYLALAEDPARSRDELAALLWSDRADEQARQSLRQTLLMLRKALDGDGRTSVLVSEGSSLALDRDAIEVDASRLRRLWAADAPEMLEQAEALLQGELLAGLDIRSEAFEEWLSGERARFRDMAADVLERLAALRAEDADPAAAIATLQRLLTLDPTREQAHRMLMRVYDRTGRRSAALKQFQVCQEILRRELHADPERETMELAEEIRHRSSTTPAPTSGNGEKSLADPGAPDPSAESPSAVQPTAAAGSVAASLIDRYWRWVTLAVVFAAVLGVAWFVAYREPAPRVDAADAARMAFPLPEKPSIAVLPFANLNGDREQDYFIDAVSEDITAALVMISEIFVIDRASAMAFKNRPVATREVAEELGIRYVLEGSVQRSGSRVRISAHLIDALAGEYVWADRYEREAEDLFALQDEITLEIITALQAEMTEGEQERILLRHGTRNLDAWVLAGQALQLLRRLTPEDNIKARRLYERAIALDADYAGAWEGLAWTHLLDARFGWSRSPSEALALAKELAEKTLVLDPARARTYSLLGSVMLLSGQHAKAVELGERAVTLSPSDADAAALLAYTLTYTGEQERSIMLLHQAMRLSPYYPDWYRWGLGRAYRLAERLQDAVAVLKTKLDENPWPLAQRLELLAAYVALGRKAEAKTQAAEIVRIDSRFSVQEWMQAPPYSDPKVAEREAEILMMAGLPP